MRAFLLIAVLSLPIAGSWVSGFDSTTKVTDISDDTGTELRGGGCGNAWKSGTVSCATGTQLCGTLSKKCGDVSVSSLVTDGAGDETESSSETPYCIVCSGATNKICGTAKKITGTKGCTSSTAVAD